MSGFSDKTFPNPLNQGLASLMMQADMEDLWADYAASETHVISENDFYAIVKRMQKLMLSNAQRLRTYAPVLFRLCLG